MAYHLLQLNLEGGCSCVALLACQRWGERSPEKGGLAFCFNKVEVFVDVASPGVPTGVINGL